METRRSKKGALEARNRASELPNDYIEMVQGVFANHFDEGLKALKEIKSESSFFASGAIFPEEILLSVTLAHPGSLAATTVHASCDFDPKASSPTVQDLLSCCVDAIGAIFDVIVKPEDPEKLAQLASTSLSAFENIPFEWTQIEINQRQIFVKVDKSNPKIDQLADAWLAKNDPDALLKEKIDHEETEKLFVTGPKNKIH